MKVLLLGKSGMLGSAFMSELDKTDVDLCAHDRDSLDIQNKTALQTVFDNFGPDFVINCAAYTAVDDCESHEKEAFAVNAEAVKNIAQLSADNDSTLIHFSTDYVFSGDRKEGYHENAEPGPINVYGKSKLAGEVFIREFAKRYYIVRSSWLFGPNGRNFVTTMLDLAKQGRDLKVVDDQRGCPCFTVDLAKSVIENFLEGDKKNGAYHLTNEGVCSWYEFAKKIFELRGLEVNLAAIASDEFPRPAKRPKCSVLLNTKLRKLRSWEVALNDYLSALDLK